MSKKNTSDNYQEQHSYTETDIRYERRRRRGGLGALFIIVIGVILLLSNLGYLPPYFWGQIWKLWPLLIVLWGIRLMLGRSRTADTTILIIATIIIIILILITSSAYNPAVYNFINHYFPWLNTQYKDGMNYYNY